MMTWELMTRWLLPHLGMVLGVGTAVLLLTLQGAEVPSDFIVLVAQLACLVFGVAMYYSARNTASAMDNADEAQAQAEQLRGALASELAAVEGALASELDAAQAERAGWAHMAGDVVAEEWAQMQKPSGQMQPQRSGVSLG